MTEQTKDERGIAYCPKGTKPYEQMRRIGQYSRNYVLKCNCGCLRVAKSYGESAGMKQRIRSEVIAEWNERMRQSHFS